MLFKAQIAWNCCQNAFDCHASILSKALEFVGGKKELSQSHFCLSEDEASGSHRCNCVVSRKLTEFKKNRIRWFWHHCYVIKIQDHCQDQSLLFLWGQLHGGMQ